VASGGAASVHDLEVADTGSDQMIGKQVFQLYKLGEQLFCEIFIFGVGAMPHITAAPCNKIPR
jgi:hypothetical protein